MRLTGRGSSSGRTVEQDDGSVERSEEAVGEVAPTTVCDRHCGRYFLFREIGHHEMECVSKCGDVLCPGSYERCLDRYGRPVTCRHEHGGKENHAIETGDLRLVFGNASRSAACKELTMVVRAS